MLQVSILKVENPSCLWGRVVRGGGSTTERPEDYDSMLSQMNVFYGDVTNSLCKLKPPSIEEGQVCVVHWSAMKLWCRAVVESVIMDSVSCKARCLLVDHGERLVVASDQFRAALQIFLQLPFWVKRFHLARIKPTTLRVCVHQENAELVPAAQWDSSATLYLHNLLQASTRTEAVLLESDSDSTSIELYLTVGNIKICVNDDLVAKRFAYYPRGSAESCGFDEVDRFPLMLSSSILTQTPPTAATQPPGEPTGQGGSGVGTQDLNLFRSLTSHLIGPSGTLVDLLTPPCSPQSQQLRTSDRDCRRRPPGGQSESSSQTAESDSSDATDSSPAADLTRDLSVFSCRTSSVASGPAETEETRSEVSGVCSRLLEWLNPEPLNLDQDAGDDAAVLRETSGILVHSVLPVQPCTSLDDAPITDTVRWVLRRNHYSTLSPADCYSWPAVSRGCNTVIVSHHADQPLSYLAPLLTHILLNSIFSSLTSSTGPIAVLLCPGWEKAQQVYDLLEDFKVGQVLHPVVLLPGVGKDEARTLRIPKNCLLLVTTPFGFVRLLSCHCFMFLRLYHLLLDEADRLFALAPDEMEIILQHFQKVTSSEEKASSPQQLVAVAKRWTGHMEGLLTNHMPYPCVVMTVPEEAALYGNVQQFILMTLEGSKISELLGTLDFSPDVGQKTLIIASCAQEVEDVFKAVSNKSAFCLKTHGGLTHQFDFVIQQWRRRIGPGTHVILVTTNECLKGFGIRDASCVVHYGFPSSPKMFGSRLFSMSENFRNLSERGSTQDPTGSCPPVARSVLLVSERNAPHVVGLLRYLGRTNAPLPPELLSFGQGIHKAREDLKTTRPLCSYLKSLGVCRDRSTCPDRHQFISRLDRSVLPASGVIEVLPLYIKTASVFYGRVVGKEDDGFDGLESEMASYYADKKPAATDLSEGGLYAVQEDDAFHRVRVLSVPDRGGHLFFRVPVRFIDTGKEEEVKSHQVLQLPRQFHSLSCQAVEIIVCRVKPADAEIDWQPKVTRAVSQKIRGLQHRARAVLSLGNTVFVDPMVRVSQVPGVRTVINEYSVQAEILKTGLGVGHPEHLQLLRALCQEGGAGSGPSCGSKDDSVSLDVRTQAEDEGSAEVLRAAEAGKLCGPAQVEATPPAPGLHPPPSDEQRSSHTSDLRSAEQRNAEGRAPCLDSGESGASEDQSQQSIIDTNEKIGHEKSFHPQIRWYQTPDSMVLTVKLRNPESQRCAFYPDRVTYSGAVGRQPYRADLELQGLVAVERCSWEMRSNQPVLTLVKGQPAHWDKLLRTKNIFVSYDVEHVESEEQGTNGLWFVGNTGEDYGYVNSDSASDTD